MNRGAKKVVGVDNNETHISVAKQMYKGIDGLSFIYVQSDSSIPNKELFDAVCMTFVHPTIGSLDKLNYQFDKIAAVTKEGADIVLLGLHPVSFEQGYKFLFYRHQLRDGSQDAVAFDNELRLPTGETIQFVDYFWRTETLIAALANAGFQQQNVYNLNSTLEGEIGECLRKAITYIDINIWKHEWVAPLYQVIHAKRL